MSPRTNLINLEEPVMTLVDPNASTRWRPAPAVTATGGLRLLWATAWLVGVPLLVALIVNQLAPSWTPIPGGPNLTAVVALVVAVLACAALRAIRGDLLLGLLPAVAAVIARFGFDQPAWFGLVAGLVIGGLWFAVRRRQRR
jgi:hypothetical protein